MDIPIPENDAERVAALRSYDILDSAPEPDFDDITELAAQICQCQVGVINFIDESRTWKKSRFGSPVTGVEVPRDASICSNTVCRTDLLVVPNLAKDERFSDYPHVVGEPHYRFYCGMPLINPQGYALGTLCVLDTKPREPTFEQTEAIRRLSRQVITLVELRRSLAELNDAHEQLDKARRESDELLLNILPATIADELKKTNRVEPRYYNLVTIMFTDFKGFTRLAESMEPRSLVQDLDQHFSAFDEIIGRHNLEKLKTIGDAYMCVGGLPEVNRRHPIDACLAAVEIQDYMEKTNRQREKLGMAPWELRIGIHSGPVMAGVVGTKKFTYDIWGDAVNIAALMESNSLAGRINISESTYHRVEDLFDTEHRGSIEAKNKGQLEMYFVDQIKPELSSDDAGRVPNSEFKVLRERMSA